MLLKSTKQTSFATSASNSPAHNKPGLRRFVEVLAWRPHTQVHAIGLAKPIRRRSDSPHASSFRVQPPGQLWAWPSPNCRVSTKERLSGIPAADPSDKAYAGRSGRCSDQGEMAQQQDRRAPTRALRFETRKHGICYSPATQHN